eukprot:Plantae.Rhodophyta-Purpureofilum_apyrenoidigerum.ctg7645.p1 GENE.Plantae.Rhodophyta-Purpureofilum_apyrenoidigerum.ctg7645~~Plantae.Rhodophyta-Purpureofilum_apyrenoidigerum.ctg7645.p1  ORF type:complete len:332 (-),score=43.73 Plantae.Rhodophyta-Purpureofilum_apyrenoidigerum.ctg7645:1194-2189(-)
MGREDQYNEGANNGVQAPYYGMPAGYGQPGQHSGYYGANPYGGNVYTGHPSGVAAPPPIYAAAPQMGYGGHAHEQAKHTGNDGFVTVDLGPDGEKNTSGAQEEHLEPSLQPKNARNAFLRKVYSIVAIQFAVTAGIALMAVYVDPLNRFLTRNWWLYLIFLGGTIITLFVLQAVRHKFPLNIFVLGVFTVLESLFVGAICGTYANAGYGIAIAYAFATTFAIFIVITAYCWISKKDFSYLIGFIIGGFVALVISFLLVFLVTAITGRLNRWVWFAINLAGSLLMTAMLLYDTSQIVNKYPYDEYLQGAIAIYTDVINLFLCLVQVFGVAAQ